MGLLMEGELRLLQAPIVERDEIKPLDYMIQNIDKYNFAIHRELPESEIRDVPEKNRHMIFKYGGKTWCGVIAMLGSEEEAECAIHSYWKAIKQLNRIDRC